MKKRKKSVGFWTWVDFDRIPMLYTFSFKTNYDFLNYYKLEVILKNKFLICNETVFVILKEDKKILSYDK